MMHGKAIWKLAISEIAKEGFTAPHMNSQVQGTMCWHTMGYIQKAFDTLNHEILLSKLKHYRIKETSYD